MPKGKPSKGLKSRVRVTKSGKVVAKHAGSVHRRVIKNAKRRRRLRRVHALDPVAAKACRKLLFK